MTRPAIGDPADTLDALADGGFQPKGTRFATREKLIEFAADGFSLRGTEGVQLVRYVRALEAENARLRADVERRASIEAPPSDDIGPIWPGCGCARCTSKRAALEAVTRAVRGTDA